MTDVTVRRVARAAARRLAAELDLADPRDPGDVGLRGQVEAALEASDPDARPVQYADPVALGSLIVSAATLAWTVYNDLRDKADKPNPQVIITRVEVELPGSNDDGRDGDGPVTPGQRAKIVETVVDEIVGQG